MTFRITLLTTFYVLLTTNSQANAQTMPDTGPCPDTHPIILAATLGASGVAPDCAPNRNNLGPDSAIWQAEDKLHWMIYGDRKNGPPHPNPFKKFCESNGGLFAAPSDRRSYYPGPGMCTPIAGGNMAHAQEQLVVCCSKEERYLETPDVYLLSVTCEDFGLLTLKKEPVKIKEAGDSCSAATKASDDKFSQVVQDFRRSCEAAHGETAIANNYSSSRCTKNGSGIYGYHSADLLCCAKPVTAVAIPTAQSEDLVS